MAKEVKKRKKTAASRAVARNSAAARLRKGTRKQEKQKAKAEVHTHAPLQNSFKLTAQTFAILKKFWKPLSGIFVVYLVLNVILTSGLIGSFGSTVTDIRNQLHTPHTNKVSTLSQGLGSLITSGAGAPNVSSTAESVLFIMESLVIIWALRHLLAGEKIKVKQSYYHSTAPLVPFLLVILMITIQLLPFTVGATVLSIILSTVITNTAITLLFWLLFAVLALWSLYMVSSSVFALYIVTLPDMQPRQALRAAKNLVRFRRWQIMRKLLFLPLAITVILGIIVVPLILLASFLVAPVFFVLIMLAILFAHTYLYNFYKGLLE